MMETKKNPSWFAAVRNYLAGSRHVIIGMVFILAALFVQLILAKSLSADINTTFTTNINDRAIQIPNWVFNSKIALEVIASILAAIGLFQIIKGFKKKLSIIIAGIGILLVLALLVWGAAGSSISFTGLLSLMITQSVPITIGAISGLVSERAGIVNIAIEGMMVASAFTAAVAGSIAGLWMGVLAAILTGALLALIHGWLSIKYKVDQIISGTMINIFATGMTSYMYIKFLQESTYNQSGFFNPIPIPLLSKIPIIGPILFDHSFYIYSMYFLVIFFTIALNNTKWGLRHRAVGEHPKAADTLGVNVFRTRYLACLLSGGIAGFAGSYFSLGLVGRFEQTMTAGRGFIALAAMIFGNWTPLGSMGAGMLFGFSESFRTKLSLLHFPIPAELLLMLPYIITIVVLAGVVGRSRGPAASGVPYEKE
jgi:general nucleoside transport system permease protein